MEKHISGNINITDPPPKSGGGGSDGGEVLGYLVIIGFIVLMLGSCSAFP